MKLNDHFEEPHKEAVMTGDRFAAAVASSLLLVLPAQGAKALCHIGE
jgi:hypothetical protein